MSPELTARQTFTFGSFVGGYNTDTDPLMVPKQFLAQVQNCLFESGWIQKSLGRTPLTLAPISETSQLVTVFHKADGTSILLLWTTTSFYTYDPETDTYTDRSPPGGLHGTIAFAPQMVTWLDQVFYTNGTDPIVTWDGVSANATFIAAGGAPNACVALCVFAGSLFAISPTTVAGIQRWEADWCDFRNPQVWDTGAAGGFVLDDTPEPLMTADTISRWMAIFKTHTIYIITYLGYSPWYDIRRLDAPGVLCRRTLVRLPVLGLFYQGPDDQYTFDGNQPTPIDKPVRKEILRLLNPEAHDAAVAWVDAKRGRVYVSLPTATATPDTIYTYSYMDGQYMREIRPVLSGTVDQYDTPLLVNELVYTVDSYDVQIDNLRRAPQERFLTTDGTLIEVNLDGVYQDARGNPIDASFTTAEVAPGAQQDGSVLPITVFEIVVIGNPVPGTLQVTLNAAFANKQFQAFGPYPIQLTLPIEVVIPVEVTGLYFSVQVRNDALDEGFQIMQLKLRYTVRGRV